MQAEHVDEVRLERCKRLVEDLVVVSFEATQLTKFRDQRMIVNAIQVEAAFNVGTALFGPDPVP
jgi:hypothetical protein